MTRRMTVDRLMPEAYQELRRLATAYLRRERPGQTLQPTALVHEAYLRLAKDKPGRWQNRAHFCAIAANAMRQILVERARARATIKRGGNRRSRSSRISKQAAATTGRHQLIYLRSTKRSNASPRSTRSRLASSSYGISAGSASRKPPKRSASRPRRSNATGASHARSLRSSSLNERRQVAPSDGALSRRARPAGGDA